jgi:hypothetical protein
MGLLDIIRGKKEGSSPDELISAGRELQAKLGELDQEEQKLEAEASELQLEAAIDGKGSKKLKDIQLRRLDLPEKKKALQEALDKIKSRLLELMPQMKEYHLRKLDQRTTALREARSDSELEVLRCLAEAACLLEVAVGTTNADAWGKRLLSDDIRLSIQRIIADNLFQFKAELERAKSGVLLYAKWGNTGAQLKAITDERSQLQRRSYTLDDAETMISTGRLPLEPAEPVRPIRPTVPSMVA